MELAVGLSSAALARVAAAVRDHARASQRLASSRALQVAESALDLLAVAMLPLIFLAPMTALKLLCRRGGESLVWEVAGKGLVATSIAIAVLCAAMTPQDGAIDTSTLLTAVALLLALTVPGLVTPLLLWPRRRHSSLPGLLTALAMLSARLAWLAWTPGGGFLAAASLLACGARLAVLDGPPSDGRAASLASQEWHLVAVTIAGVGLGETRQMELAAVLCTLVAWYCIFTGAAFLTLQRPPPPPPPPYVDKAEPPSIDDLIEAGFAACLPPAA